MHLQIIALILWPRRSELPPRIVSFRPGTVNVITGLSKTGKSAIIPIIDYCLGAEKCSIPVKTIRQATAWFGVLLDTAQGQLLLARREPGLQKSTGDMYATHGTEISIPNSIDESNTNVEQTKQLLNDLAGLTQLDFDAEGTGSGYKGRPSFRDMMAFVFQPQNIVANPNVLFYKADSTEHREKLRTIFPYVLGAVTTEALALEHEVSRLRTELRRKERELGAIRDVSSRWLAEIQSRVTRAFELGLLTKRPSSDAPIADMLQSLREAASRTEVTPQLSARAFDDATQELVALQREESLASATLSELRHRFAEMTRFREATTEYRGSLSIRRDRLQVSRWIGELFRENATCPLCGTTDNPSVHQVRALQEALKRIEEQTDNIAQVPVAFDREYQRIRDDIGRATDTLNAVRYRRRALEATSEEVRERQYVATETARFSGSLDESLARYDALAEDSNLNEEVTNLRDAIASIDEQLRRLDVRASVTRAIQRFAVLVARIVSSLDIERPNDPVELSINDLTLKIAGDQRDDYLWEIGSGANWLSYHIATTIALHEIFLSLSRSPVPTFTIYDQPSQVYFPQRVHASDDEGSGLMATDPRDEDVRAVRQVFAALALGVQRTQGEWQAIVLDHASTDVWGGIEHVHLVEDWRGGRKLVPDTWLR